MKFSFLRYFGLLGAWVALFGTAIPASAWNATGHRAVAAIAYDNLKPKTRARVDEMIRNHPDYATLLTEGAPTDPAGRARAAFIAAGPWADVIRGDPRFYDNTRADAVPTPTLPGFPDMGRHSNWHYYDIPYTPDGVTAPPHLPPSALSELRRIIKEIGKFPAGSPQASYDLLWLIHLEGDVHQPLHCTSRFLKIQPKGDAGGNFVIVEPNRTLHSLWDDSPGSDTSADYIGRYILEATAHTPRPRKTVKDPMKWIEEGYELDKSQVYTFGNEIGSREHPLALPAGYEENARRVAKTQIAIAGYRLAAVLNDRLK